MNALLNSTKVQMNAPNVARATPALPTHRSARRVSHLWAPLKDTLSDKQALASIFLLVSIISLSAMGGYTLGQSDVADSQGLLVIPVSFSKQATTARPNQSGTIQRNGSDISAEPGEITRQLGLQRAELLRLHSLYVHLAEQAELDDGEFDVSSPLLEWDEHSSAEQLGLLKRRIAHMSASGDRLQSIFHRRRIAHDQRISGRPVANGNRSSGFGYRKDPITGKRIEHQGLDYSGSVGEPILALADGIVTYSGVNSSYGNLVELEHVDGLRTRYAHNQANLVTSGSRVKKGDVIATLGSTGRSTGPHVHIEVRLDGSPIDPGFFIH